MSPRALLAAVAVLFGCSSETNVLPVAEPDTAIEQDSSGAETAVEDTRPDIVLDSGCPAPAKITPSDLPSTYFPAERVNLNYTVDGDTAHFFFASGEKVVRFLYVDTEETSGAEKTAFGEASKVAVDGFLKAATEILVAPRKTSTGAPDLDPYGRTLALVFVDGELLETRIIRGGWSVYFAAFKCAPSPIHEALLYAEAEANANDRGIWAPGHPKDYRPELERWSCRPNPFTSPYCK